MIYKDFFFDSYNDTKWIPMFPFSATPCIGDVFQIHQGRMRTLLNINNDLDLVHSVHTSDYMPVDIRDWRNARGCLKVNDSLIVEQQFEEQLTKRQQDYRFNSTGDYLFYGQRALVELMLNWSHLAPELIVKLTQSKFTFRQVYVITGVVNVSHWGLAIAGSEGAELSLLGEQENSECLFEQQQCHITNSQGLAFFQHSNDTPLHFFKAKKLIISDIKYDQYLHQLYHPRDDHLPHLPLDSWLHSNLLSLSTTEQLNINTCQDFFQWQNATLDDVLLLTGSC